MQTSGENKKNIRPFRIVLSLVALLVAYGIFQAAGGFSMEIFRKKELDTKTEAAYREAVDAFNIFTEDFTALGRGLDEVAEKDTALSADFLRETRWAVHDLRESLPKLSALPFIQAHAMKELESLQQKAVAYLDRADLALGTDAQKIEENDQNALRALFSEAAAASEAAADALQQAYESLKNEQKE
ncbi:MAG: hypothetical protein GX291_09035 [Tissierellia bacterium]|jgi:hypothetical protein|nr:hypothetical protein [Bacillota bacterium]NLK59394.1 hypothetical protein [Tissierellia bacterium]